MKDTIMVAAGIALVLLAFWPHKKQKSVELTTLDAPLFHWNDANFLSPRGLLGGGIHAFGRTDSGKTSSLKGVARAILSHGNSSMLVLCAKRNEYKDWLAYATDAGRSDDVVLIDPDKDWRFNMIGYEAARLGKGAGQAVNVTRFIMELRSVIFRESAPEGGDAHQWKVLTEQQLMHAVTILLFAGEPVTPGNLHGLIFSAPETVEQMSNAGWQAGDCNHWIAKGFEREKSDIEQGDFESAAKYFLKVWPTLADRTRSSISVGTLAALTTLNTGLCREMFSCRTNITPHDAIEGRKIVIVNMPPDEWGDVGMVANIGWKYHWQKEVLRRSVDDDSPIAVIWGDESSLWVTANDARFVSLCRSYRGCMVYICQSIASYKEVLPSDKADAIVDAMLGNFSHKLFFALGDYATAQWAADLVGKELQQFAGGGVQHNEELFRLLPGNGHHSSNFSEHYESVIQPGAFMNGLRTGSPVNRFMVDAILVRSGVPFSNGLPFLGVTFDQRT